MTSGDMLVISKVEAFRDLVRKAMSTDFESAAKTREPGDLYVTQFRGNPLINVTGRTDKSVPEVVWLREMIEDGQKVTGAGLARSIAENEGHGAISGKKLMDFCMAELDGKNVQDGKSPIRIVENLDFPLQKRGVTFNMTAGNASNSQGIGSLENVMEGIQSIEQAKLILQSEAGRLKMTVEEILDPKNITKVLKKSPVLRKVLKFFSAT